MGQTSRAIPAYRTIAPAAKQIPIFFLSGVCTGGYEQDKLRATKAIRAYHLRDKKTGKDGPWLAGMTLEPSVVYEAWCAQWPRHH